MAEDVATQLSNVSTQIEQLGAEGLIKKLFGDDISFNEYHPEYKCLCSREYIEKVLISLGKNELEDIIKKEGEIKVDCQFCNNQYRFTAEDVDKFFG